MRHSPNLSVFFAVLTLALVAAVTSASPALSAEVVFRPPTDAAVLDPFRLPDGPYGAGNRGIEYATRDGSLIRAAAAGVVTFAGPVAGSLFVTVDHGDGLRSTYGFVAAALVARGAPVQAGTPVAVAGGPFHFGTRLHGQYVDPATLFGVRVVRVRLVAHHRDAPPERPPRPHDAVADDRLAALAWSRQESLVRVAAATHEWMDMALTALRDWGAVVAGRLLVASRGGPATLHGGPNGPRTTSDRRRRTHFTRAMPGHLGVRHGCATGKRNIRGSHLHEAAVGGRRPFRPPDPPVEPEDEAVHPRRAVRDPHRGSPPDPPPPRRVLHLRA